MSSASTPNSPCRKEKAGVLRKTEAGAWVAQSVGRPASAQAMISQLMGSSPASGAVPTAQSPLRILCPPLAAPPPTRSLSVSLNKEINR